MKLVPVSIIVPSYNGLRFSDQIIDCLRPYHDAGYEIILVEDGSTDGVKEKVIGALPNVKYIWKENGGVSAARHAGINEASGEFIQLLDIDDTIEPGKLEAQYEFAVREGCDLVYSDWRKAFRADMQSITEFSDWVAGDTFESREEDAISAMFNQWWFPVFSPIISKKAYLAVNGGDHSLKFIEDYGLWLPLLVNGFKYGYCPGEFGSYFKYGSNTGLTSHLKTEQWWVDTVKVFLGALVSLFEKGIITQNQKITGFNRIFRDIRNLAKFNKEKAKESWGVLVKMDSDFSPSNQSSIFMACFKLFGYPFAENVALSMNSFKKRFGGRDNKDNIKLG